MRVLVAFLVAFACAFVGAQPADRSLRANAISSYKLGAGDVISIKVFGEDDLSRDRVKISDAGTVPYPVLGELKIQGRTVGELEKLITDGLRGRYLVNPRVAVTVEEYRQFFVNGQVDKPGGYAYQPGLTVAKAISLAGGLKERASVNKMYLVREDDAKQGRIKADMNTDVRPGDILTIEESFF
jgi:polysaccharide biosynthesis/export protein VpsN